MVGCAGSEARAPGRKRGAATRAVIQVFLARGAKFVSAVKTGSKNALEGKLLLEGFASNDWDLFFFAPPKTARRNIHSF